MSVQNSIRNTVYRSLVFFCFAGLSVPVLCMQGAPGRAVVPAQPTLEFIHGNWWDGHAFKQRVAYSHNGYLTFRRPVHIDRTIDLHHAFVVPPFAEAHNHNVETLNKIDALISTYLRHGIFYVKNPNNLARDRDALRSRLNQRDSIDVIFSNGSLTASGGHPTEIPERVIRTGKWTQADSEGGFYYTVDNRGELDEKWPILLNTHPDFIKTFLLYSDQFARRRDDPHFYAWKGLDPALLAVIVEKAHAAGLRVSTHIENGADFHNALVANVDEINHMPGFRYDADVQKHPVRDFEISDADARRASRQGTYVVTTLGGSKPADNTQRETHDRLNVKNLSILLKHHVKLALGSDAYRSDTLSEALYINSLHVMSNAQLLNIWCTSTVGTIFPRRRVGKLKEGYEASFLALESNPVDDFLAVHKISLAVKQGHVMDLATPSH